MSPASSLYWPAGDVIDTQLLELWPGLVIVNISAHLKQF